VTDIISFEEAYAWLSGLENTKGKPAKRHLLLGNGFSIAFDVSRFSYSALRAQAESQGLVGRTALRLFTSLGTQDFELVIRSLMEAARALAVLDATKYAVEIQALQQEAEQLKEALAQVLAGLHPERPYEVEEAAYRRVRQFIDRFDNLYTANYDLLLYWALRQDFGGTMPSRRSDDGFRDSGYDAPYVLWDYLQPHSQCVFYIHGALHLYRGEDGLRKLTWIRTDEALIDQIRQELASTRSAVRRRGHER
jgi:hypothetical protein